MKTKFSFPPAFILLLPLLLMAGCSNPSSRSKITPTINITQARQTVEANLTQVAGTPQASTNPAASPTLAPTSALQTLVPTNQASPLPPTPTNRKSTRLNSSHSQISYAVFCLKKKKKQNIRNITFSYHACTSL